jgi:hypothetical protein
VGSGPPSLTSGSAPDYNTMQLLFLFSVFSSSSSSEDKWDALLNSNISYLNNLRSCWIHDLLKDYINAVYFKICIKHRAYPNKFKEYFRMSINTYDYILNHISNNLKK